MASSSRKKSSENEDSKRPARKRSGARPRSSAREQTRTVRIARTFLAWFGRTLLVLAIGVLLGGSIVVVALMREARDTVETRLKRQEVWSEPGRVFSGPLELWPGLQIEPGELASALRGAGYAQVGRVTAPGDFHLDQDHIELRTRDVSGPAFSGAALSASVRFKAGRIAELKPSHLRLEPVVLSTLSGDKAERRQNLSLSSIPADLRKAVLLMEDQDFYEHPGLSITGVLRALWVDLTQGDALQGGSTLTQQLAKNLFLGPERTFARKSREAFLALALESELGKDDIFALYLNGIYLGQAGGQAIHGVGEASRVYFGKPAERLSLGEGATLAGIISAPNSYSPLKHPERAIERRDLVLRKMASVGYISSDVANSEIARPFEVLPTSIHREAPWGVDLATEEVETSAGPGGISNLGLVVHTSLSPILQRLAERAVSEGLAEVERAHPSAKGAQAALVAMRVSTGEILALVGGRSYAESSYNRAAFAYRPLGSVIKPFTTVLALESDPSLASTSVLPDLAIERRVNGKTWSPANYDGRYLGEVTLREALSQSRNIPFIHLAEKVGFKKLETFWKRLGFERATSYPSAALGAFDATPLQVAGALGVLPSGGRQARPFLVRTVLDQEGEIVYKQAANPQEILSARATALTTRMLQSVLVDGTGARASEYGVEGEVAGKSGTTDDGRDAWFVGYTPEIVVVAWVGFDKERVHGLSGAQAALPIWARFMASLGSPKARFPGDSELDAVLICREARLLATSSCPLADRAWFNKGQAPVIHCPLHEGGKVEPGPAAASKSEGKKPEKAAPTADKGTTPSTAKGKDESSRAERKRQEKRDSTKGSKKGAKKPATEKGGKKSKKRR